jgi:uncharacterized protein YjbJ (UPF0337 family)
MTALFATQRAASARRTMVDKSHVTGQMIEVENKIKQLVNLIADDDKMENEGRIERAIGRLEAKCFDATNEVPKAE